MLYRNTLAQSGQGICNFLLLIPILFLVISCQNNATETTEGYQRSMCEQISEDSLTILKGTLYLNSKGTIVFEKIDVKNVRQRKIHLIPCSNNLKDYIFKTYDTYLNIKNYDEKYWVSVEGKFLSSDTLKNTQNFLFRFVALIDELEAKKDSSHAMREIENERLDALK